MREPTYRRAARRPQPGACGRGAGRLGDSHLCCSRRPGPTSTMTSRPARSREPTSRPSDDGAQDRADDAFQDGHPHRLPVVAVVGPTASGKSDLALGPGGAARRGGGQRRRDAALPRHGHRHGQAVRARAPGRPAPPARRPGRHARRPASRRTSGRPGRTWPRSGHADACRCPGRRLRPLRPRRRWTGWRSRRPTPPCAQRCSRSSSDVGVDRLRERLAALDPHAASAIQPNNGRRIVRALEVIELTGRPFSATLPTREHLVPTVTIGLAVPRPELDERIAARVHRMWDAACWRRSRRLDAAGLREGRTAARALGYSQALAAPGRAARARPRRVEDTITATRGSPGGRRRGSAPTRASTGSRTTTRTWSRQALARASPAAAVRRRQ